MLPLLPTFLNFLFIILMIFKNTIQWKICMCSLDSLLFSFACFRTSQKWYHSACHLLQFDFVTHYVFEFYLSCLCHCSSFIICCCSVAKSYATLRDPMNCSMPGFSVHHYLPEFAQIQAHSVNDAIQPSHLLSPPLFLLPSIFSSIRVFSSLLIVI